MLNFLRKNAQSVIIQVIVVVIAIVFVFWGVGAKLKDNPNAIAVVMNGPLKTTNSSSVGRCRRGFLKALV